MVVVGLGMRHVGDTPLGTPNPVGEDGAGSGESESPEAVWVGGAAGAGAAGVALAVVLAGAGCAVAPPPGWIVATAPLPARSAALGCAEAGLSGVSTDVVSLETAATLGLGLAGCEGVAAAARTAGEVTANTT